MICLDDSWMESTICRMKPRDVGCTCCRDAPFQVPGRLLLQSETFQCGNFFELSVIHRLRALEPHTIHPLSPLHHSSHYTSWWKPSTSPALLLVLLGPAFEQILNDPAYRFLIHLKQEQYLAAAVIKHCSSLHRPQFSHSHQVWRLLGLQSSTPPSWRDSTSTSSPSSDLSWVQSSGSCVEATSSLHNWVLA